MVAEVEGREVARPFPPAVVEAFATKYGWDVTVDVDDDIGAVTMVELVPRRWVMGSPAT